VNCLIIGNVAGDRGGGVFCSSSAGSLEFCTLSDNEANAAEGAGGGVYCSSSTTELNSIIIAFSEGSGIYFKNSSGAQVAYCDFYGSTGDDVDFYNDDPSEGPAVIDHISADPQFLDRPGGDFHIRVTSPCQSQADPLDHPDDDFYEDNPQRPDPLDSDPDIGADESPGPSIVPALNDDGTIILLVVLLLVVILLTVRGQARERW